MLPQQFQNLIKHFSKFPGIGSKQATRFAFHLLRQPQGQFDDFINNLANLKKEVKVCQNCSFIFDARQILSPKDSNEPDNKLCSICNNPKRNKNIICVVEKESDVLTVEKTGNHGGTYHILGGNIYSLQNDGDFILKNLKNRLVGLTKEAKAENIEIILALNTTPEGDATSSYIERELKDFNIKITRLARGLSRGADLEYADHETLAHAIRHRS